MGSFSFDGLRIVSGSYDGTIRMWNAQSHELIGEAQCGYDAVVHCLSESADGYYIVSRCRERTIIWQREGLAILWMSKCGVTDSESDEESNSETGATNKEHEFENMITNDEAEKIIRNCGQQTPRCGQTVSLHTRQNFTARMNQCISVWVATRR